MPLEVCDGGCVDLRSDPRYCGSCERPCGAGLSCSDGECGTSAGSACAARTGGAFVTVEKCGGTVKLWITNEAFTTRAESLVQGGPVEGFLQLELLAGADCDPQWTWHANGATASFVPAPHGGLCDVCPAEIERLLSYYVLDVGAWCPSSATVVAVDRQ